MSEQSQKCIECGEATYPIMVLDAGHLGKHTGVLCYTAVDAKRGWFSAAYPVQGKLAAELCCGCGRVVFRAVPLQPS